MKNRTLKSSKLSGAKKSEALVNATAAALGQTSSLVLK
jgi:hypothetical protein